MARFLEVAGYFAVPFNAPRTDQDDIFTRHLRRTMARDAAAIVFPTVKSLTKRILDGNSNTLPITLSSWHRNMDRLSALIDRLSELATTAPQEHRRQLNRRVAALRKDFKKQQRRYAAFLRLTKEYADRFLEDITEEIQQQSSFLDALERRLDMAKNLRQQAVHLRKSYEVGTLNSIMKVRHTGAYSCCIFVMYRFHTSISSSLAATSKGCGLIQRDGRHSRRN